MSMNTNNGDRQGLLNAIKISRDQDQASDNVSDDYWMSG